jgi:hypothetical protein
MARRRDEDALDACARETNPVTSYAWEVRPEQNRRDRDE